MHAAVQYMGTFCMRTGNCICCEGLLEHFNSRAVFFGRSSCFAHVFLSQPSLPLCTLPSICDPTPHSTALTLSCRPFISALINLPSRCRPHSWRWTSQLFLSPLTTPSLALFRRPLPWLAPSIDHASSSRTASLDLSLPSAHQLKALISISCLHSVS